MPNIGKVIQVMGPVVDVMFEDGMPSINNALKNEIQPEHNHGVGINLTLQV